MKQKENVIDNSIENSIENNTCLPNDAMEVYVREAEVIHKKRVRKLNLLKGLGVALLLAVILCLNTKESKADIQQNIANQIIRFHVLANSDCALDQNLKLKVKNEVVLYMQELLKNCSSKTEAEDILLQHRENIIQVARQVILKQGYDYTVTAKLENIYFPVKVYGDLTFPAGEYEAFRILIGKAEGKNWWCVMYPNLCMINETYSIVPEDSKNQLRHVLSEEEYEDLSSTEEPTTTPDEETNQEATVEYHFWILDWIASLF